MAGEASAPRGVGRWRRAVAGRGLAGLRWGPRSRLQVPQDERPELRHLDITGCCLGPPLLCVPPREKRFQLGGADTLQTRAPRHWCPASLEPCP